jgi:hypothetical protein
VTAEMDNIRSINKDIYREVKNPYLQLFLILMIEKDGGKDLFQSVIDQTVVNIFDFVTLACKFLDKDTLFSVLQKKIMFSVKSGNLDAVPLIGLNSP